MKGQRKSKTKSKKKIQISTNNYLNVWIFKKHKNEKIQKTYKTNKKYSAFIICEIAKLKKGGI